jgi:hypothetical protein
MNLKMKIIMKALLNYKWLVVIACLAFNLPLTGQTYQNSRSVREARRIAANTEVQVINKYGDIHLIPWEKDSVVFEIDLKVTSNKQSKVDKIFDYIDFDFKSTSYYVIAKTVFEGQDGFWGEMADVASTIFSSGTSTRIDYTVYFPAGNNVRIENKFGNIYTTDHTGKVDITLSNGDMKGHSLEGPSRLKVEFGNVTFDKISEANITLGYAELHLEECGEINFESRSSKIYLTRCEKLHLDSRRDRIYVKSAGEVTGETFFSFLNLDKVNSKVNIKTNYGDVKILAFSERFTRMDLSSQYTDINIYLDDSHLFDFEITRDDKSQVLSSANIISKKEEPVAGMEKTYRSSIQAGKANKQVVTVVIKMKSGKVYLL